MGMNIGEIAEHRGVRDCLQWFTREKQWINEIHLQLCRVPAPTFLEQQRADWIQEQFRTLGWKPRSTAPATSLATLGEGPYVALTAHLDTVLAPRTKTISASSRTAAFAGPASPTTAPGWPALLAVARALKVGPRASPTESVGLVLVANVGEEGEGNLLRHALSVQAIAAGARNRSVPRPGRRQLPTTSPRAAWAAAASR